MRRFLLAATALLALTSAAQADYQLKCGTCYFSLNICSSRPERVTFVRLAIT
jgi:hypothetical protein